MATEDSKVLSLESLMKTMPTGPLDKAILNHLRGINHRNTPTMVPSNKDLPGYLFFVRPQLNMQRDNLRNKRKVARLISDNPISMQTFIRAMLDPRLVPGFQMPGFTIPGENCPIIDNCNPFIPFLTNSWESISGWPSLTVPTNKSKAGLYNESFVMVDGRTEIDETFDITVNFANRRGNPVAILFYVWALYMGYVVEGKLVPYLDFITENELDYNTRIYHFRMDYTNTKITMGACTRAAVPVGIPIGDFFNVSKNTPVPESNKEISMQFTCSGVDYLDDIVFKEFNQCVAQANPMMEDAYREKTMIKIDSSLATNFNYMGYPYVNMNTSELEWWIDPTSFDGVSRSYLQSVAATAEQNQEFEGD